MTQKNSFFKFTTKLVQENQIEIKVISDPLHIWMNYSRVIYALVSFFTGGFPGVIVYIMLAIIIPEDNGMIDTDATNHEYRDEEEK